MAADRLDERFYQSALDGLKSYRRTDFTVRFLKQHGLPVGKSLGQMWADIREWVGSDDDRCRDLLKYVDELRMWGRQRVFLFEVEEPYAGRLSESEFVRGLVGGVYDKPIYRWETEKPLLVDIEHRVDPASGSPLLVSKLVETRRYDLLIDDELKSFEERSTNFLIVDLREHFAELRIQELPAGARRSLRAERDLLREEIGRYLDFDKFTPIRMEPVMRTILRSPIYPVTSSRLKSSEADFPVGTPTLTVILNRLFRHPTPTEVDAHWECDQDVLGNSPLHFRLNATNDFVAFGGIADPDRIRDILKRIVDVGRGGTGPIEVDGPLWKRGAVERPLAGLEDQPRAQAVLLSVGAIAASIIWIVISGVRSYLIDEWWNAVLRGVPVEAVTIPVEIAWTWFFYGSDRIRRSFRALWSFEWPKVWSEMMEARDRGKAGHRHLTP